MWCGTRCRPAGGRLTATAAAISVQERARLQVGGRARGRAHVEHLVYVCDAGRVEAQCLVERRCVLPRVERRACDAGRDAAREAGGRGAAGDRGARGVQGRARLQIGSRARGGAHEEHVAHVRDAGGIEAQRLVERRRVLPRVERKACGAGRDAGREPGGGGRPRGTQRSGQGSTADSGQSMGRSAPRTWRTYL